MEKLNPEQTRAFHTAYTNRHLQTTPRKMTRFGCAGVCNVGEPAAQLKRTVKP